MADEFRIPCRVGTALYILKSLPVLIVPWGFFNAAFHVVSGMVLALAGVAASVVSSAPFRVLRQSGVDWTLTRSAAPALCTCHNGMGAALIQALKQVVIHRPDLISVRLTSVLWMQIGTWFLLSAPVQPHSSPATTLDRGHARGDYAVAPEEEAADFVPSEVEGSAGSTYAQMVAHMIPVTASPDLPPPSLSHNGEFSDWVYTIPTVKYDRAEVCTRPSHGLSRFSDGFCSTIRTAHARRLDLVLKFVRFASDARTS